MGWEQSKQDTEADQPEEGNPNKETQKKRGAAMQPVQLAGFQTGCPLKIFRGQNGHMKRDNVFLRVCLSTATASVMAAKGFQV